MEKFEYVWMWNKLAVRQSWFCFTCHYFGGNPKTAFKIFWVKTCKMRDTLERETDYLCKLLQTQSITLVLRVMSSSLSVSGIVTNICLKQQQQQNTSVYTLNMDTFLIIHPSCFKAKMYTLFSTCKTGSTCTPCQCIKLFISFYQCCWGLCAGERSNHH